MKVLRTVSNQPGTYVMHCPGCDRMHQIWTLKVMPNGNPTWKFNGDMEKPTFSPSLLVQFGDAEGPRRCHSFIRNGQWEFLNDCTHRLAGETVPMIDVDLED